MQEKCKSCRVPEIIARMNTMREAYQAAKDNARLAESPTQAQPFIDAANDAGNQFESARAEHSTEVKKQCFSCTYPN